MEQLRGRRDRRRQRVSSEIKQGGATITQKNKVFNGADVEVLEISGENKIINLTDMRRKSNGESIESANVPQMIFTIKSSLELKAGDILIKSKK